MQQLRSKVELQHNGKICAIDIETDDYEIGDNDLKAIKRLLAKHPEAIIYSLRTGVRAVYGIGFNVKLTHYDNRKSYNQFSSCD